MFTLVLILLAVAVLLTVGLNIFKISKPRGEVSAQAIEVDKVLSFWAKVKDVILIVAGLIASLGFINGFPDLTEIGEVISGLDTVINALLALVPTAVGVFNLIKGFFTK